MNLTNDDDLDGPSREFSLPQEIVPATARPTRLIKVAPEIEPIPVIAEAPEAAGADFSRYLHSIRRNWLLGSVLGILFSVPLAALMWVLNPKEFTATEIVRVSPNHTPLIFETVDNQGKNGYGELKNYKNTQRQLLLQPTALNKAIKDPEVASLKQIADNPDPIGWLQENLKVVYPDDAEIMNVTFTSTDPVAAHRIVKSVVDVYMKDVVEKDRQERLSRIERLRQILSDAEEKVRTKRGNLGTLVEKFGTGDTNTINLAQQSVISHFGFLRQELSKVTFELLRAKSELIAQNPSATGEEFSKLGRAATEKAAEEVADTTNADNELMMNEAIETDPDVVKYTKEVAGYEHKIELAQKRYDPKVAESYSMKYRKQLEDSKAKLAERKARVKQLIQSGMATSGMPAKGENLPLKIKALEAHAQELRDEMSLLEAESRKFGRSSIEVEMMRKEITNLDPIVDKVTQEIERTTIELQSASRITRYQSTGVPTVGESKRRIPLVVVGGAFGLFAPMGLLVFLDSLRNPVNNVQTINNNMNLPVLGSLPRVPAKIMKKLYDPNAGADVKVWRDRMSESVAGVTAMLLRKLASEGNRIVMVASAVSGEGKSTLSEQLARSLADSGHRTLLVDFDLRRPVLHQRMKFPVSPGVSDVLRSGVDLKEAVIETDWPNLSMLTAGNVPGSLLRESANGTLDDFFDKCRAEFEFVIVDSSPQIPVVDGRLVGQHTDGVILAVLKDRSQLGQVASARGILTDYGVNIFGCVVSGESNGGYYYNSYEAPPERRIASTGIAASRSTSAM
ncbi:polysaccharide biosynthesis tyrosine autokinase [Schlesneria sp. DSM 10557]|uniref:polysaccharide biosynthesis tyrosine autokinase n=2 Tax=unclassified Schlesneria TaxID=2762017 RepID=UPI00359FEE64